MTPKRGLREAPLERVYAPVPPYLLAVVRVIAEAQATVIGDLRQVFIIKFFQAYVLRRPGEETRSESKDRAPGELATLGAVPGSRSQEGTWETQLLDPRVSPAPNSQIHVLLSL